MSDEAPAKSSRTASIARILGISAPVLTVVGVGLCQIGLPPMIGFGMFAVAILLGLIALVLGVIGLFLARGDATGRVHAITGLAMGALMVFALVIGRSPGADAPAINDITTNVDDPPAFQAQGDRDMSFPPPMFAETFPPQEYRADVIAVLPRLLRHLLPEHPRKGREEITQAHRLVRN